jgi:16S rRNA (guanine966-N2)-methyltransferase
VAGEFRGRKLTAPDGGATRPTTDRVREAIFNALSSLDVLVGAAVADLYAGSGALGIEALSRGAAHCTFVETDRSALSAIHDNIAKLGIAGRTRVISGDVIAMLPRVTCDLAFADPPYGFDRWARLLDGLACDFLVAEAPAAVEGSPPWQQRRLKRYGRTWVTFLARAGEMCQ